VTPRGAIVAPGSVAFVVGGSTGIGLACASRFAQLGAHVALFARRKEPLEEAARSVRGVRRDSSQQVLALPLDASVATDTERVFGEAAERTGPPDLLLNCAGGARPGNFDDLPRDQLDATLRVNLHTAWNGVRAVLPHMKRREQGGGVIVNTASLAGLIGVFGYTDYCAAKFALIGFSEALRSELAPRGIRVCVLCPPDTETPGLALENATKPPETRAVSETASLLTADQVAQSLLSGLSRRHFLIVPGRRARLIAWAGRHLPGLARRVMDREVRSAQRAFGSDA
jgi:NAD(P)-dependent dehydrogenase (short-subunit alcohol dehydrogenase family)